MNSRSVVPADAPLKRFAFTLRLREGAAEAYDQARWELKPEMRDMRIKRCY